MPAGDQRRPTPSPHIWFENLDTTTSNYFTAENATEGKPIKIHPVSGKLKLFSHLCADNTLIPYLEEAVRASREATPAAEAQVPLASEMPIGDTGSKWLPQPPPPGDPPGFAAQSLAKAEETLRRTQILYDQNFKRKQAAELQATELRDLRAAIMAKGKKVTSP